MKGIAEYLVLVFIASITNLRALRINGELELNPILFSIQDMVN